MLPPALQKNKQKNKIKDISYLYLIKSVSFFFTSAEWKDSSSSSNQSLREITKGNCWKSSTMWEWETGGGREGFDCLLIAGSWSWKMAGDNAHVDIFANLCRLLKKTGINGYIFFLSWNGQQSFFFFFFCCPETHRTSAAATKSSQH